MFYLLDSLPSLTAALDLDVSSTNTWSESTLTTTSTTKEVILKSTTEFGEYHKIPITTILKWMILQTLKIAKTVLASMFNQDGCTQVQCN